MDLYRKYTRALTSEIVWQAGALLLAVATWSVSPSLPHSTLPICSVHLHLCTPYVSQCYTHSCITHAHSHTHTHTHTQRRARECRRRRLIIFFRARADTHTCTCTHSHMHTCTRAHRCRRRSRVRRRSGFSTALPRYMSKETYYRTKCQKRPIGWVAGFFDTGVIV